VGQGLGRRHLLAQRPDPALPPEPGPGLLLDGGLALRLTPRPGGAGAKARQDRRRGAGRLLPQALAAIRRVGGVATAAGGLREEGPVDEGAGVLDRPGRRRPPGADAVPFGADAAGVSAGLTTTPGRP